MALVLRLENTTSNNKDSYGHTKGDAFAIAEKAVKGKLKSPSTAKFCSVTEATIGCSGNTWVVRGWVNAQNGFGATVRTQSLLHLPLQARICIHLTRAL